ncbi:helix-turn-helix domain-containing protein [Actinoplanes sp. NPDC089786]|uniref:helix-turn-helix transcriptional regulator n=1 Tax=Actinoplanes sp. NPDC089786 TaxID=3155185 RepID=UPI00343C6A6E
MAARQANNKTVIDLAQERERRGRSGRADATPKAYLTVADFCTEMDVARSTFYDWRAKRLAPQCIKLPNGELRIRRSEFERWLAEHEERAA